MNYYNNCNREESDMRRQDNDYSLYQGINNYYLANQTSNLLLVI